MLQASPSAFLNAAIGQLYGKFSEETIRASLGVSDMEQEDLALLKRVVILNTSATWSVSGEPVKMP